jgi:hypothetical protein
MSQERQAKRARVVDTLLSSEEPAIRWRTRALALGEELDSKQMRKLQREVRESTRVKALLAQLDASGAALSPRNVYAKWQGAHWILASLADLGYPSADATLRPVRDQILDCWLAPVYYEEFSAEKKKDAYKHDGVPVMHGRHRRCASQQGYALYFLLQLGLENERIHALVERLLHWQWPDGGWNCDKEPSAAKSTFIHTLHSLRGLHLYSERFADKPARRAAKRASEVLLSRRLYKRVADSTVIKPEFVKLHYPLYWHYDILLALKAMAETGQLRDPRCNDALDLLESKELAAGGWPAESRYYSVSSKIKLHADFVDWGGTSRARQNPWVTIDALSVLRQAGRWQP